MRITRASRGDGFDFFVCPSCSFAIGDRRKKRRELGK
jgi:hypothetical protein